MSESVPGSWPGIRWGQLVSDPISDFGGGGGGAEGVGQALEAGLKRLRPERLTPTLHGRPVARQVHKSGLTPSLLPARRGRAVESKPWFGLSGNSPLPPSPAHLPEPSIQLVRTDPTLPKSGLTPSVVPHMTRNPPRPIGHLSHHVEVSARDCRGSLSRRSRASSTRRRPARTRMRSDNRPGASPS